MAERGRVARRVRRGVVGGGCLVLVGTVLVLGAAPAVAATYSVTDDASFRAAWQDNASSTVQINLQSDITLACAGGSPTRNSSNPATIDGNGHTLTFDTSPCNGTDLLNQIGSGDITVQNATLTHNTDTGNVIHAIVPAGAITLTDVTLQLTSTTGSGVLTHSPGSVSLSNTTLNLSTTSGSGVVMAGGDTPVTMTNSTISGSSTNGFGIGDGATVTMTNSTINMTTTGGGNDISTRGSVTMTDSALLGSDSANGNGIVVSEKGSPVTLTRSTVARPSVTGDGILSSSPVSATDSTITNSGATGIFTSDAETVNLVYADVVNNGFGVGGSGGHDVRTGSLTTFASVLTRGASGACDVLSATSNGYNFADDTTCSLTGTGDRQAVGNDAALGALADNGGPTATLLPQPGSPLVDGVPSAACQADGAAGITADQRSLARPDTASPNCDIGAVEVQPPPPTTTTTTTTTQPPSTAPTAVVATARFTG